MSIDDEIEWQLRTCNNRITVLEAQNAKLVEALTRLVECADGPTWNAATAKRFREARAVLSEAKGKP